MKYPCFIEFAYNGRLLRIVHKNQTTIAEIVVHGNMEQVAMKVQSLENGARLLEPRPFQAEAFGLAEYEEILGGQVVEKPAEDPRTVKKERR